jgi:hypothetical protein
VVRWKCPKKLGEVVCIIDPDDVRYNTFGYKQASRVDDGVVQVMVYFPLSKSTGEMKMYRWDQCERLKEEY